jgi:hypothetical protein
MSHLFHTAVSLRGQTWLTPNKWSSIQTVLSFLRYHIPFGTR